MLKDVKLFTGKSEKVENLITGYGERVCMIINELLNRELIKNDFWFKDPVFTNQDENKEEGADEDDN